MELYILQDPLDGG